MASNCIKNSIKYSRFYFDDQMQEIQGSADSKSLSKLAQLKTDFGIMESYANGALPWSFLKSIQDSYDP